MATRTIEVVPRDEAPQAQTMERVVHGGAPPPTASQPGGGELCFGCCAASPLLTTSHSRRRNERVFYDSARAQRTFAGRFHYCIACPGWSKATSERVVYSRWNLVPLAELPNVVAHQFCGFICTTEADWLPAPDTRTFVTPAQGDEDCCAWRLPCGRALDTFDADIIVDASAHQTLLQICRGEGDVVLYRKAGADLSDPSEVFVMTDVRKPFDVFNEITFELSKINLQGATTQALGRRMGATVWSFDARSGTDNASQSAFQVRRVRSGRDFRHPMPIRASCPPCGTGLDLEDGFDLREWHGEQDRVPTW